MKRFFRKLFLVCLPFVCYAACIVLIDPSNYFNFSHLFPDTVKTKVANPILPKLLDYARNPVPNIMIGDSRMASLSAADVSRTAGEDFFNFSFGGSSLNEMIDVFWYASSKAHLRHVYIGLNFSHYSDYNFNDRVSIASSLQNNPLLYLTNRTVLTSSWDTLWYSFTGMSSAPGVPNMTKEEFWREQVAMTNRWYGHYVYPSRYSRELHKISAYCKANNIALHFVLLPCHTDLIDGAVQAGLQPKFERYKREIAVLGPTCDYETVNNITSDRNNYLDPLHFNHELGAVLIRAVWSKMPVCSALF